MTGGPITRHALSLLAVAVIAITGVAFPTAAHAGADCAGVREAALAAYGDEPGFVDAFVRPDGVVALFDADARGPLPLPAPVTLAPGLETRVDAQRFVPLIAVEDPGDVVQQIPQPCVGIRPGVAVSTPVGGCSANFVFRDSGGALYVGTAGHCFGGTGEPLHVTGIGTVGTSVFVVNEGVGRDFALVRIDPGMYQYVDPAMCHWGGPTGEAKSTWGTVLRHYGNGLVWGETQYTRARTAAGWSGVLDSFTFIGAASSGDSGSGMRVDDGGALGVITHVNGNAVVFGHSAPFGYGTSIARAIALAEAGTGLDLELLTAPVDA